MTQGDTDRLIEWTGERCVPWADDTQVIYEHYHRYALAAALCEGKRVLDLACGEGYGAALIAARAAEVVAVDIDEATITHARRAYAAPNLTFELGSITDPDLLVELGKFDVIACFEAIEHVVEQERTLELVRNRLSADGVFLVSTPDTDVYSHDHGNENPYHVRELTEAGFRDLLGQSFANVVMLRQNVAVGSVITGEGPGGVAGHTLSHAAEDWTVREGLPHTYLVAAASNAELPKLPAAHVLLDPDLTLVSATATEIVAQRDQALAETTRVHEVYQRLVEEADQLKGVIAALEQSRKAAERTARQLEEDNERALAEAVRLRAEVARLAAELGRETNTARLRGARMDWLSSQMSDMEARAVRAEGQVAELRADLGTVSAPLRGAIGRYRQKLEQVAPRGTLRRDAYERALGRAPGVPAAEPAELTPVAVQTSTSPLVSIVIPTYGKWAYTRQCLVHLAVLKSSVPFEVIVVDDASPDDSADRVAECPGVRLVRAERNLGFVGACNLGAAAAKSDLLVFLNNDTEVRPGWLDELFDTMTGDERIGLVGSKLVYPDGALQECGGIIWSDGSGWNYGRGGAADDPAVDVVRDVDYCSGAAIMVRRDLFEEVGRFDQRYAPAYYEDTDLAFAIRATGHRVVVQPNAVVVHHEGVSHGTDVNQGVKRHQELNRTVFAEKWAAELARQRPEPSPANFWMARQRDPLDQNGPLVLVVDHKVPTPDMDAGSVRIRAVIEEMAALGCRVVFFPANHAMLEPYTGELRRLGVTVLADPGRQRDFLREVGAELEFALLARPSVAWTVLEDVRENAPRCTVAYDTVDLHFLRLERQAVLAESAGKTAEAAGLRRKGEASRESELGLVRACDLTLVVSSVERELLGKLVPEAKVEVLSLVQDVDWTPASPVGRSGLIFVGGYDHLPNRDAAQWLAEEIMPLVWAERPETVLHLVGSNPPKEVLDLAADGIEVHGFVQDLSMLYAKARVAVAPLRYGAGVKGKIAESTALGVPTVLTSIGLEGTGFAPGEDVLVGDTAAEIATSVIELLDDDEKWLRLSDSAKVKVDAVFGRDVARRFLQETLFDVR